MGFGNYPVRVGAELKSGLKMVGIELGSLTQLLVRKFCRLGQKMSLHNIKDIFELIGVLDKAPVPIDNRQIYPPLSEAEKALFVNMAVAARAEGQMRQGAKAERAE